MTESPDVKTVSAFEIEEAGLSAVLTDAIEDQREVVEYLDREREHLEKMRRDAYEKKQGTGFAYLGLGILQVMGLQDRAKNVLNLLEAAREREAGGVA